MRPVRLPALAVLVAVLLLTGPRAQAQDHPFPLMGDEADLAALVGNWVGGYEGEGTGRSGAVAFRFAPGADTAHGHIVMLPGPDAGPEARPVVLELHFVWVEGARVEGTLERYADPVYGTALETRFRGTVAGDRIEGVYESTGAADDTVPQHGRWWAERRPSL
ncbi:MAG TPA: hypothetical protein VK610_00370 [Rhodothermales bacterium]|nr:hypothetical protein [Rhodothermales bacterium]